VANEEWRAESAERVKVGEWSMKTPKQRARREREGRRWHITHTTATPLSLSPTPPPSLRHSPACVFTLAQFADRFLSSIINACLFVCFCTTVDNTPPPALWFCSGDQRTNKTGRGKVGGEQLFALGSGMKTNIGGYLGALVWVLGNRTNTHTTRVPMLRFTAAAAAIICTK